MPSRESLISGLQKLESDLGRSPTITDVRECDIFSSEYEIVKEFESFNRAKEISGIEINKERSNDVDIEAIKEDGDLAYFLGVLAGDGSVFELSNGSYKIVLACKDKEMIEAFKSIGEEKFGINAREGVQRQNGKKYYRVDFCSKDFGDYLGDWGWCSWTARIHGEFSWIKEDYPENFLSGLFDAEGTRTDRAIRIYCQNVEGLEVIRELLEMIGISNYVSGKRSISVKKQSWNMFDEKLNPRIKRKVK